MANGAPDYYSQTYVDIVAQTLGSMSIDIIEQSVTELINRGTYGKAENGTFSLNCGAGDIRTLIDGESRGAIYNGFVYLEATEVHPDDQLIISLDGDTISNLTLAELADANIYYSGGYGVHLNIYNPTDYIYCVGIQPLTTFEESFEISWYNDTAVQCLLTGGITFATV